MKEAGRKGQKEAGNGIGREERKRKEKGPAVYNPHEEEQHRLLENSPLFRLPISSCLTIPDV